MFLSSPERSVRLPDNCYYGNHPCCNKRDKSCLLSVCGSEYVSFEATTPITLEDLALVHRDPAYLTRLCTDAALVHEVFELSGPVDDSLLENVVLPLRFRVTNLVLATQHAYFGRSIVMVPGAGQHHASPDKAMGAGLFCDVPLAWLKLRASVPGGQAFRALYVDVDVHHANGFAEARDQLGMHDHFFMLDVYNADIWPFPEDGSGVLSSVEHVNIPVPIHSGIGGRAYLAKLKEALDRAHAELPNLHMLFYMCSLDALEGDPQGKTKVSAKAVYKRDRMVVAWARQRGLPVVIMPGAGYGPSSCRVARESMARLNDEFKIW
jgi:acetoin utilization deacetylase AcuC-like enzyme